MEHVILVDENDQVLGTEEKIQAHRDAKLHRAFSIFIFNAKGEMMLQRRAEEKYHCGGLWTNTCCSHPQEGETPEQAAHRKLKQEMGFDTELKHLFWFIYKAPFDNGLTEHELDHVFIGTWDGEPEVNPEEAADWKWAAPEEVRQDVAANPDKYTPWFKIALDKVIEHQQAV